jgi:ATP synthase F1 epsilon subunit
MEKEFNLVILTPQGKQHDSNVYSVNVKTRNGYITVLAQHANIISTLRICNVSIIGVHLQKEIYGVGSGIIKFKDNKLVILTDWCKKNDTNSDPVELRKNQINQEIKENYEELNYDNLSIQIEEEIKQLKD